MPCRHARHAELRARHIAEQRAAAESKARLRTCCICEDDAVAPTDGVECAGDSGAGRHFTCDGCFGHHVMAESEKNLHDLLQRGGQVFCPARGNGGGGGCLCAVPFPEQAVAEHCRNPEVFGAFMAAQKKVAEHTLVRQMEHQCVGTSVFFVRVRACVPACRACACARVVARARTCT